MEPMIKRLRSEDVGSGTNPRVSETHEWRNGDMECRRYNTPEGCPFGSNCRFRHGASDNRDISQQNMSLGAKPKPCMKFFSTSGCQFGEACHFLHYAPGGVSSIALNLLSSGTAASSIRKPSGPVGDPSFTVNGYKTKLCNRFGTSEGCRFGEKCHFAHGEKELRTPSNSSKGNVSYFDSYGNNNNSSDLNSQGYSEPNPPGVPADEASANYPADLVEANVPVY
ncbi:hypothetical protein AMTRI_Chr01g127680 [Amborella trichopoda]